MNRFIITKYSFWGQVILRAVLVPAGSKPEGFCTWVERLGEEAAILEAIVAQGRQLLLVAANHE